MASETLKITESGLEYHVLEKVPPQMGKSQNKTTIINVLCAAKNHYKSTQWYRGSDSNRHGVTTTGF